MTPEQIKKLAALAASVSTMAPLRLNPRANHVYINHHVVAQIRRTLDEAKIDWRQMHKDARVHKGDAT